MRSIWRTSANSLSLDVLFLRGTYEPSINAKLQVMETSKKIGADNSEWPPPWRRRFGIKADEDATSASNGNEQPASGLLFVHRMQIYERQRLRSLPLLRRVRIST